MLLLMFLLNTSNFYVRVVPPTCTWLFLDCIGHRLLVCVCTAGMVQRGMLAKVWCLMDCCQYDLVPVLTGDLWKYCAITLRS